MPSPIRVHRVHRSWRASDGTEFADKREAEGHENFLALVAWAQEHLEVEDSFKARVIAERMQRDRHNLSLLLRRFHFNDEPPKSVGQTIAAEITGGDEIPTGPSRKRPRCKDTVLALRAEGKSPKEIAQIMGKGYKYVTATLRRYT